MITSGRIKSTLTSWIAGWNAPLSRVVSQFVSELSRFLLRNPSGTAWEHHWRWRRIVDNNVSRWISSDRLMDFERVTNIYFLTIPWKPSTWPKLNLWIQWIHGLYSSLYSTTCSKHSRFHPLVPGAFNIVKIGKYRFWYAAYRTKFDDRSENSEVGMQATFNSRFLAQVQECVVALYTSVFRQHAVVELQFCERRLRVVGQPIVIFGVRVGVRVGHLAVPVSQHTHEHCTARNLRQAQLDRPTSYSRISNRYKLMNRPSWWIVQNGRIFRLPSSKIFIKPIL